MVNDLINHVYVMRGSGVQRASRLVNAMGVQQECGGERAWRLCTLSSYLALLHLFCLVVPELYLFVVD